MHIEWLIEQIDAYCAQNAEFAATEEDGRLTWVTRSSASAEIGSYKAEYQACLEFLIDEMKGRLG
jgi:5-hydroxyisourate hydrolase-like protein (transthyretin family)